MSGVDLYQDHFASLSRGAFATEPAWLRAERDLGFERFAADGFPTPKLEDWRYTNVASLARTPFRLPDPGAAHPSRALLEPRIAPAYACNLYVFVNGRLAPELSTHAGPVGDARVASLRDVLSDAPDQLEGRLGALAAPNGHAFSSLNTALFEDGAFVHLSTGSDLDQPIHLVFATVQGPEPVVTHPRILIVAEPGSRATVIEDYVSFGDGQALTNAVTEVSLGAGAHVDLVRVQREGSGCSQVSRLAVNQGRDSRFASHVLTLSGDLVRNDVGALLAAPGADCRLDGLFAVGGNEHVDNHTLVDHAEPHCSSRELYKGILAGSARGVFNGRVIVRQDAQHTDAQQQNKNLLLSKDARIDTQPQLEIYADDVKCSHGSTIGQLDPDARFYLRARGIPDPLARLLLMRAFASEILEALPVAPVGERVAELLAARLGGPQELLQ